MLLFIVNETAGGVIFGTDVLIIFTSDHWAQHSIMRRLIRMAAIFSHFFLMPGLTWWAACFNFKSTWYPKLIWLKNKLCNRCCGSDSVGTNDNRNDGRNSTPNGREMTNREVLSRVAPSTYQSGNAFALRRVGKHNQSLFK